MAAERGLVELRVEGADRDDALIGGGEVHRIGTGALVPGGRDQHDVMGQGVGDRRLLGAAAADAGRPRDRDRVQRQVDDARVVVDRVPDPAGDGAGQPAPDVGVRQQGVVAYLRYPHRQDAGGRAGAVAAARDEAGDGGAVDAPERPAGRAAGMGVVGARRHRPTQVSLVRVDPGVEDGDGQPARAGAVPRLGDVQRLQPPFLAAHAVRGGGGGGSVQRQACHRKTCGCPGPCQAGKPQRHRGPPYQHLRHSSTFAGVWWVLRSGCGQDTGVAESRTWAPGGSPSCCAASPALTAIEMSPALSVKATISPGATAANVSR